MMQPSYVHDFLEPVPQGALDFRVPCPEIDALAEELALRGVRFEAEHHVVPTGHRGIDAWHVVYPGAAGRHVSVIWSPLSYGHKYGLLEAWDLDERSDPRGWLTAGDVLRMYPLEDRP